MVFVSEALMPLRVAPLTMHMTPSIVSYCKIYCIHAWNNFKKNKNKKKASVSLFQGVGRKRNKNISFLCLAAFVVLCSLRKCIVYYQISVNLEFDLGIYTACNDFSFAAFA